MNLVDKIEALARLGVWIQSEPEKLRDLMYRASAKNPWFTIESQHKALHSIARSFLDKKILTEWTHKYHLENFKGQKKVGMILAGNIPLVGFHDVLCCFIAGHYALIKYSEKDDILIPALLSQLGEIDAATKTYFQRVERLKDYDAVIATGSNNTSRYFEQYFGKNPNIIRKNRNGIAVFDGNETKEQMNAFASDIFDYFGLGCRNVSKAYFPKDYDFVPLLDVLHEYKELALNHKYKNNFDYCMALNLLNKSKFYNNGCLILVENEQIPSRISTLHYEHYDSLSTLKEELNHRKEEIQCVVSNQKVEGFKHFGFGKAQSPNIDDYADGVDTIQFLMQL